MQNTDIPMGASLPGPFKCPDCGVWWAGWQHECVPETADAAATRRTWKYRNEPGITTVPWPPVYNTWSGS